jgi:hypothetical protein
MPCLKIHFPGKEGPTVVALKGERITIGRRPENTIQIVDRTLSSTHAELVTSPDGYYLLRDLGSTNGTAVNDQVITEYHLSEPCRLNFGAFQCEYRLANAEEQEAGEPLLTMADAEELRKANADLQAELVTVKEELESFKVAAAGGNETQVELQRLLEERGEPRPRRLLRSDREVRKSSCQSQSKRLQPSALKRRA